jgi:hypothetical protein
LSAAIDLLTAFELAALRDDDGHLLHAALNGISSIGSLSATV